MTGPIPRDWLHPPTLQRAAEIQRLLAKRILAEDALGPVRRIAGADISFNPRDPDGIFYAAIVVLDFPALTLSSQVTASLPSSFPYRTGFLGFREIPCLLRAYEGLTEEPDLIFVDGHGLSHPRGLGVASHFAALLDRPTIGVAKTILIGRPAYPVGPEPGDRVPLVWRGRSVGTVLRTKRRANPLYISTGHRISTGSATDWVMRTLRGYRFPEPIRQAHLAANAFRRSG